MRAQEYIDKLSEKQGRELSGAQILAVYNHLHPSDYFIPNSRWESSLSFYRNAGLEELFFKIGEKSLDILAEIPEFPN